MVIDDNDKENSKMDIDDLGFDEDSSVDFEGEELVIEEEEDEIIPSVLYKGIMRPKTEEDWRALLLEASEEGVPEYQISATYGEGDLIKHPLFGLGVVSKVITPHKIEIVFKTDKKLMAMNITPPDELSPATAKTEGSEDLL